MTRATDRLLSILKSSTLIIALIGVAVTGPMVAYAGVSVVYPESTTTGDIDTSPPVTLAKGSDWSSALSADLVASWSSDDSAASVSFTIKGLEDGNVTIDALVKADQISGVSSHKIEVTDAIGASESGGLVASEISDAKLVFYDDSAASAPGNVTAASVCAWIDLTSVSESSGSCDPADDSVNAQLFYELNDVDNPSTDTATIKFRPSSIVFS